MYCSKCGEKLEEDAEICSKCGKKVIREKEYSMKYFDFFSKYYTKLLIIYGIIFIFSELQSLAQVVNLDKDTMLLIVGEIVVVGIIYVILPIGLSEEMPNKTQNSYLLLLLFLILAYTWRVAISTISVYLNNGSEDILLYVLLYIILYATWYIPNIIYFTKRKDMLNN